MAHEFAGAFWAPRYWGHPARSCNVGCLFGNPYVRLSLFDIRELVKLALRSGPDRVTNARIAAHLSTRIIKWIGGPVKTDILAAGLEVIAPFQFDLGTFFCLVNSGCPGVVVPAFFDVVDLVNQLPETNAPGGSTPAAGVPFGAWTNGHLEWQRR